jgi:flagellar assembly factor FliW
MTLTTSRFGVLTFGEEQVIAFPSGVSGVPGSCHCVVVDDPATSPFRWLVCIERPECTFAVLDPMVVLDGEEVRAVRDAETTTFVVATPGSGDVAWWLDLRHPILIATAERRGEHVTLDDSSLPDRFPVTLQQPHEIAG